MCIGIWRASEASKTLYSGVELRIGDICLYICGDVRMSFCTLTLAYFCVSSVFDPVPNFTKQNPPVSRSLPVPSIKLNCLPI